MLNCQAVFEALRERGITYYTGVPDSLLKDFCSFVTDHTDERNHVIAANEGGAVALAAGYHLATGRVGLVYMQNSGQGNAVNPLVSLADPKVYGIPMLLVIGWRGEPGRPDEPQHVKQGEVTLPMLDALGIRYEVLPDTLDAAAACIERGLIHTQEHKTPFALVVKKGTFSKYKLQRQEENVYPLSREQAIRQIADSLGECDVVVSTTGMPSRELFEHRVNSGVGTGRDFFTVGSMGHASMIALTIAESRPDRRIYCLDGDGALIMHMGAMAIIGTRRPANYRHIVLNNGAHDSVGGQPTAAFGVDIPAIAAACGYAHALRATSREELERCLQDAAELDGPLLLEVRVARGSRPDLGRPTTTPMENKQRFMEFIGA